MKLIYSLILIYFVALLSFAQEPIKVPIYGYKVVNTYPHNITSFTQGLEFHNGFLYEGTGQKGRSTLSKISLENGKVLQIKKLPSRYYGEGITIVGNRIFQLTYKSNLVFVYDLETFENTAFHYHPTEGWGLTSDGETLILSDGSEKLQFIDPDTFEVIRTVKVTLNGQPITDINELEYINGEVWANVWKTNDIVRIAPATGQINSILNLDGLIDQTNTGGAGSVLNGIAWLPSEIPAKEGQGRLFVTGKLWADIFEIEITKMR
jgi:glutamine cyclotransferase